MLEQRVAEAGDVVETEPCFELTREAVAYLAECGGEFRG